MIKYASYFLKTKPFFFFPFAVWEREGNVRYALESEWNTYKKLFKFCEFLKYFILKTLCNILFN